MAIIQQKYLTGDTLYYFAQWAKENLETFEPEDYDEAMLKLHPVGSYYWSSESTDPGILFGGTWVVVSDYYMYATNNTSTGGSSTVTLTSAHMPSHSHTIQSHTHMLTSHSHSIGTHTHTIPSSSHRHSISHMHPYVYGLLFTSTTANVNKSGIGGIQRMFSGCFNPAGQTWGDQDCQSVVASITLNVNQSVNISDASGSITLDSGGAGTSNNANTTITGSNNGSNYSLTLDPPYINAYCWYRSA